MEFSADLIDEHVWLGSIDATEDKTILEKLNITHILSIIDWELEINENDRFIRKHIKVDDIESTDLLSEFNSCYDFIAKALADNSNNNVLIHCAAGVSRSATIACMWLMRRYHLSASDALKRLRSARPCVCPNPSFAAQLYLFEQMNHQVDTNHDLYKEFQFERARTEYLDYDTDYLGIEGKNKLRQQFRQAFTLPYGHATCQRIENYFCKECQTDLFTNADISRHEQGSGMHDWFKKYSINQLNGMAADIECQRDLFTNQLEWLMSQIDTPANPHSDSIKCPSCSTIIGEFNLNGSKCSCGKWISPAYEFDRNKLEQKTVTDIKIETKITS